MGAGAVRIAPGTVAAAAATAAETVLARLDMLSKCEAGMLRMRSIPPQPPSSEDGRAPPGGVPRRSPEPTGRSRRGGRARSTDLGALGVPASIDIGLRAELAVRGLRCAPPLRRHAGAGPSDDGHWTVDGTPMTLPMAPDSPWSCANDGTVTRDGVIVDIDVAAIARPRFY